MFDKDTEIKKSAGIQRLNDYSNFLELQTLCEFLNTGFETILESDDTFCTKVLLSNLEKSNFEKKYMELKSKQKGK